MKFRIRNSELRVGNTGFTVVELLVVAGIMVVIGGLIAGVIFGTLRGSSKTSTTNYVAQNGNFALSSITDEINASISVRSPCDNTARSSIQLERIDEQIVTFTCEAATGNISLRKGPVGVTPAPITLFDNNQVRIENAGSLAECSFRCAQVDHTNVTPPATPVTNIYLAPGIEVNFLLKDRNVSTKADTGAQNQFRTSVTLRNYVPIATPTPTT